MLAWKFAVEVTRFETEKERATNATCGLGIVSHVSDSAFQTLTTASSINHLLPTIDRSEHSRCHTDSVLLELLRTDRCHQNYRTNDMTRRGRSSHAPRGMGPFEASQLKTESTTAL